MNDLQLSNWQSDLIVGAWRNGLGETPAGDLPHLEKRLAGGYRLTPGENLTMTLVNLLDAYDDLFSDFLGYEPEDEGVPV